MPARLLPAQAAQLLEELVGETLAFDTAPTSLDGGRSADLFELRLAIGPSDLVGRDLVLRVLPDGASTDECIIQAAMSRLDDAVPRVARWGLVNERACMVMERIDGRSLFEQQSPLRGFTALSSRLAALMVALHRLDPAPVAVALAAAGSAVPRRARERAAAEIDGALGALRHPARAALMRWFEQHEPPPDREVVCHGDLHALNVLIEQATGRAVLIDWELAAIGEPAYDIARTKVLLHAVPMDISRMARPLVQRLGRGAAARFEAAYSAMAPVAPEAIAWHEVLHAARAIGLTRRAPADGQQPDAVAEAWRPTLPLLTRLVERVTGVRL